MSNATTRTKARSRLTRINAELQGTLSSRARKGKWTTKCLASSLALAQ